MEGLDSEQPSRVTYYEKVEVRKGKKNCAPQNFDTFLRPWYYVSIYLQFFFFFLQKLLCIV